MRLSPAGKAIKDAGAHDYIVAALEGKSHKARIANTYQFVCGADNNFNAITAAYQLLRREPKRALIASPIEIETEPDSTLQILTNLLNNTLQRDTSPHALAFDDPEPLYQVIGHCENVEPGILYLAHNAKSSSIKIYRDAEGAPVFAKGYSAPGTPTSALAFQPTRLWGVYMPAGLIAEIHDHPGSPQPSEEQLRIDVPATSEHIRQVYPMRLSRFALSHAGREQAFGAYETNRVVMDESSRAMTLQYLGQLLV
jgi:hypothetical protein